MDKIKITILLVLTANGILACQNNLPKPSMKIKEIHLLSDNLNSTAEFYTSVLELPAEMQPDGTLAIQAGNTTLVFHQSENAGATYHVAFDIPNNKLREAHQWLKKKASIIPVSQMSVFADFDTWFAKSFYFYDNNGNVLEFICRDGVANASDAPFDSSMILYASEIGIVTDNVAATAKSITKQYGIPNFSRQTPSENFAALGDDYGLFVIVHSSRNWYPTATPAKSYWSRIVFDMPGRDNLVIETK